MQVQCADSKFKQTPDLQIKNSNSLGLLEEVDPTPVIVDVPDAAIQSFCCPISSCAFQAKNQSGLSKHLKTHNDCMYCGKTFSNPNGKRNLEFHLKTHNKR